jgi:hypothetical protein
MTSPNFNELLKSKWSALFQSDEACDIFRNGFDSLKMKTIEGGYLVYFNEAFVKNKRASQVDFAASKEEQKSDDIKEGIFKEFDENKFNFNDVTPHEILFYVNLDDETVIPREVNDKYEEDHLFDEEQLEQEISETENHPVIVNVYSPTVPTRRIATDYWTGYYYVTSPGIQDKWFKRSKVFFECRVIDFYCYIESAITAWELLPV